MKVALVVILVTLCCQIVLGNTAYVPGAPISSSTPKPWTRKLKDGVGKFLEGAAVLSALAEAIRGHSKHKLPNPAPALHKN